MVDDERDRHGHSGDRRPERTKAIGVVGIYA